MLNQVEKFHTILNVIKSLNIMDTDLLKTIMELESNNINNYYLEDNEDEVYKIYYFK